VLVLVVVIDLRSSIVVSEKGRKNDDDDEDEDEHEHEHDWGGRSLTLPG
jgi:hypothetical protein